MLVKSIAELSVRVDPRGSWKMMIADNSVRSVESYILIIHESLMDSFKEDLINEHSICGKNAWNNYIEQKNKSYEGVEWWLFNIAQPHSTQEYNWYCYTAKDAMYNLREDRKYYSSHMRNSRYFNFTSWENIHKYIEECHENHPLYIDPDIDWSTVEA